MKKRKNFVSLKPASSDGEGTDQEEADNGHEAGGEERLDEDENMSEETDDELPLKKAKKKKPGIIYVSSIPEHMNVAKIKELLGEYGDIGRIFLQPDKKFLHRKKKKTSKKPLAIQFTEGWVEFESKRVAKWVAENLNAKPISKKKGNRFCDVLWALKYLPRFKWVHLSERLSYEKAVYRQKLQNEISQARKEANFFQANLDRSERLKKIKKKQKKAVETNE